jgi:general secretion pathway protein I
MRRNADRGFTLIEVLAALIIVALGMLAVIKGVNETVRNSNYLRDKTLAHWIAMNQLTEVRLSGRVPEMAKSDGDLQFAGQKWRWKMNVTQTPVKSMRRIDINVRRDGMPDTSSLAAITGFYGSTVERPGIVSTKQAWAPTPALLGQSGDPNNPNPANEPNGSPEPPPPQPSVDLPTGEVPMPNNPDDAE